jgi:hypothetical protein
MRSPKSPYPKSGQQRDRLTSQRLAAAAAAAAAQTTNRPAALPRLSTTEQPPNCQPRAHAAHGSHPPTQPTNSATEGKAATQPLPRCCRARGASSRGGTLTSSQHCTVKQQRPIPADAPLAQQHQGQIERIGTVQTRAVCICDGETYSISGCNSVCCWCCESFETRRGRRTFAPQGPW